MNEYIIFIYTFIWLFLGIFAALGMGQIMSRLKRDESDYTSQHAPRLIEFLFGILLLVGAAGHGGIGYGGGWSAETAPRLLLLIALWDVALLGVYAGLVFAINRFMGTDSSSAA